MDVGSALTGTELPAIDEFQFRQWLKDNAVPFNPDAQQDYDMRGFYKGVQQQNPHAQSSVNENDGQLHFNDYYKMPWHDTYSSESKGAGPDAPSWNKQDQLVDPSGKIMYDEKFMKILRGGK